MGHRMDLDGTTLLQGAGISLSGAVAALLIAVRTHAQAPVCGLAHCPACYVAAGLALMSLALGGLAWSARTRAAAIRRRP